MTVVAIVDGALIGFALLAAATPAPVTSAPQGPCAVAGRTACVVDLHGPRAPRVSSDCTVAPWSRYVRFLLPGKFVDSNKDGWWESVIEIALDPAKECGCAKLRIFFDDPVRHWALDIGDSPTNNGYGGDSGTTTFCAETQIRGDVLAVLSATSLSPGEQSVDRLLEWILPPLGGRHADVQICDQVLEFDLSRGSSDAQPIHFTMQTPTLGILYSFTTLPGTAETEGIATKDRGLYLGLNRVIHSPAGGGRVGTGVKRVEITLLP